MSEAPQSRSSCGPLPFNVRPCRIDPVFGLLRERWKLSPLAGGALLFLLYIGGNFLFTALCGTAFPRPGLDQPFTRDPVAWVLYGFLVPVGAMLGLRFFAQIETVFERIYSEGLVRAPLDDYDLFLKRLDRTYNSVVLHVTAFGAACLVFGWITGYDQHDGVASWQDLGTGFSAVVDFALGLIAWYAAHVVLAKIAVTAWAMHRVLDWPVNVQPLHPDGCGGFRLFTEVAITIALFAAIMGMAAALIIMAGSILRHQEPNAAPALVVIALESMTPLIFFGCLYRAHREMAAAKARLLKRVHRSFQPHFEDLQDSPLCLSGTEESTAQILQLDTLHTVVEKLPVWPTDVRMIVQVLASVAVPIGLLFLQILIERAME